MKKLITILFLLISVYGFGQADGKPRYTQLKPIPASHITDLQDSINANTKLAGIEAGAQVNVAETDPIFAADSASIIHWSDTLTTPGIATKADVENATITETDPIVGAITGIAKSNGAGTISQAVGDTDYLLPNTPITGAIKTKITYDAQGLVTSGADATTADIAASTDKNYVTDAEAVVIGNTSGTNTGDQTITLISDVTGSGTGSFATTIAASAVTLAKMADVATGTVFYRKTAATGVPEVQTLATLKTDLGLTGTNSGDQTITLTGGVTGSGTGSFAATVITNANLTGDVTSIGNATTIGADKILETMLKSVNIPTDEYALTYESTTGDFEWQEMTAGFTDPMTTAYDLIWKNGSNVTTRLPIGTNSHYLGIASGILGYKQILGSEINNTESWTANAGTVTSVTAGNGMTQSGTSTINPTLNVVSHAGSAGTIGTIDISADAIGVDLGTTNITAYRGDYGNTAYSHSQLTSGNPHSVTPTELSLVIGTNTQAYDVGLTNLAGVAMVADRFYYTSADNVHVAGTVTSFARTILDDADQATVQSTLNVDPSGTDNSTDVSLNASATTGGMSISTQEISNRAATNAQTGYMTAALVGNIETNNDKVTNSDQDLSYNSGTHAVDISDGNNAVIPLALADGATEGLSSFTAADFNATAGNISIDYTNAQKASTSVIGFLTNTDWNTFNNKTSNAGTVTSAGFNDGTGFTISGTPITSSGSFTFAQDFSEFTDITESTGIKFVVTDPVEKEIAIGDVDLSDFNNDVGYTANVGTVTSSTLVDNSIVIGTTSTNIEGDVNITWDGSNLALLNTTGSEAMTITQYYADNDNVYPALRLKRDNNTVTPGVDGIGVSLDFSFEDYASTEYKIGSIQFMRDGADTEGALEIWGGNQATDKFLRFEGSAIMQLPRYTSAVTVGSEVYNLSVDASGYVITTTPAGGGVSSIIAGDLIDVSSATGDVTVNVDLSELSTDATATTSDYIPWLDNTNGQKKMLLSTLATLIGGGGGGTILGSVGTTDNAVPRANGTGGVTLQSSGVIVDDSNNITGVNNFTATGELDANGNIELGAGSTIFGSSTSNITINTNKFVVTGSSGNTTIGGTLDVVGNTEIGGGYAATGITATSTGNISMDGDLVVDGEGRFGVTDQGGQSLQTATFISTGTAVFDGFITGTGDWGTTGDISTGGNFLITSPDNIPASASATGTTGTISWDASYIYVCTATDTWKRVAIATW